MYTIIQKCVVGNFTFLTSGSLGRYNSVSQISQDSV